LRALGSGFAADTQAQSERMSKVMQFDSRLRAKELMRP
jgi:hypothetical protein